MNFHDLIWYLRFTQSTLLGVLTTCVKAVKQRINGRPDRTWWGMRKSAFLGALGNEKAEWTAKLQFGIQYEKTQQRGLKRQHH